MYGTLKNEKNKKMKWGVMGVCEGSLVITIRTHSVEPLAEQPCSTVFLQSNVLQGSKTGKCKKLRSAALRSALLMPL